MGIEERDRDMTTNEILDRALMGLLSETEYVEVGMKLFKAGYVHIDPLASGGRQFPLSDKGRNRAIELSNK